MLRRRPLDSFRSASTSGGTIRTGILLTCLAGAVILSWYANTPPTNIPSASTRTVHAQQAAIKKAAFVTVQSIHKPEMRNHDSPSEAKPLRNPFVFADLPPAPIALSPPPPPPPPPEIKPQSRFIGTVDQKGGALFALFSLKNEVTPLREGGLLEERYIVAKIGPDSVLLQDHSFGNTATITLVKK